MHYEGKVAFNASPAAVWAVVMDVDQFAACMPGVENLTRVDDRTFTGAMKARVGPVSSDFAFRAEIVDSTPPTQLMARVEGSDSLTKSTVTSDVTISLQETASGATELAYRVGVDVKGRIAIIGDMVLRATGAQVIQEFFRRLRERVEGVPA